MQVFKVVHFDSLFFYKYHAEENNLYSIAAVDVELRA